MPVDKAVIDEMSQSLYEAERSGYQVGILTSAYPDMNMDDAYAIQRGLVNRKLDAGQSIIGWKIGLTSKAMQDALKIDIPDSGVLFDNMQFSDGATVPAGRFIQPRIEAEITFIMKTDLTGPNISREDVIDATEYVVPALEILDTRIVRQNPETGALRKVFDTIADNAANAGIVLGKQKHKISDTDLRWIGAIVMRDDIVEETGLGAGVLNDPVTGIVWLANRLAEHGESIRAGDVVLSGSFIRPIEAPAKSKFYADFGPFGSVSIAFD